MSPASDSNWINPTTTAEMDLFQKMRIRFNVPSSPSPERRGSGQGDHQRGFCNQESKVTTTRLKVDHSSPTKDINQSTISETIGSSDNSASSSFERKKISLKRSKAVNPMSIPGLINSTNDQMRKNMDVSVQGNGPLCVNHEALSRTLSISSSAPPLPPRPQGTPVTNNHHMCDSTSRDSNQLDTQEWRRRGKEMVDYIADYMDTIHKRRVTPNVEPGYLKALLPESPPYKSENWDTIMSDFEKFIMPGVTHWQHPRFHAYFPAGNSYPSILADMISDGIGCIGFSWVSHSVFFNRLI